MAIFFFDSSALLKRYVAEPGSRWIIDLLGAGGHRFYVSRLTRLECIAALSRRLLLATSRTNAYNVLRTQ
jgi:hypothetical protein